MSNDPKKPNSNDNGKKPANNSQPDAGKVLGMFILGTAAAGGLAAIFKTVINEVDRNPRPVSNNNTNKPAPRKMSQDMIDKLKRPADRPKKNYFD